MTANPTANPVAGPANPASPLRARALLSTFGLALCTACPGGLGELTTKSGGGKTSATAGADSAGAEGGEGGEGGDGDGADESPCPPGARALPQADELCPPGRQIVQVEGDCPPPTGDWTVETMFSGQALAAKMGRYCRYLWTNDGAPADLGQLPNAVKGQTSADCRVFPQSLPSAYERAFGEGVGLVDPVAALARGQGIPVHVAVVDTAPALTSEGRSVHGPAIAAIVARAAAGCVPGLGDPSCRRTVETHLGMPQVRAHGPDSSHGGYYGYQTDLAEGIVAAVNGWANADERLIVNLAVGWEPSLGDLDGNGETSSAAIRAVRDAVALADCRGALVIAASGNRPFDSCVDQATGPGTWERVKGWTAAQCQALGLSNAEIRIVASGYHPLLHTVTPIDWGLANLADHRPGSDARVAALGQAGFAQAGGRGYGPLTGSSVSTAVVSGIAALVWSYYPDLGADALMELIHVSGTPRTVDGDPVMATTHLGQTAPTQRVASACAALAKACRAAGVDDPSKCAAIEAACAPGVDAGAWGQSFDQATAHTPAGNYSVDPERQSSAHGCSSCGDAFTLTTVGASSPAGADPWILPQPNKPPCPTCVIKSNDLTMQLEPEWVSEEYTDASGATPRTYTINYSIERVFVDVWSAAGGQTRVVLYDVHASPPSTPPAPITTTATRISDPAFDGATSATITVEVVSDEAPPRTYIGTNPVQVD